MTRKNKLYWVFGITGGLLTISWLFLRGKNIAVLNPAGTIAAQERDLMIIVTLLMLIVVIPVYILLIYIPIKYRETNKKAHYRPDWDGSRTLETIWWGVPLAVIVVLAGVTWKSTHTLDPFRPIQASAKPIKIQVVALQYKWLFIYPEQDIATVNYVQFPKDTPVQFEITADAPMNSFWIPQLGGQIYAMSGMSTQLYLSASKFGDYRGVSANLSGEGFAKMDFTARASSQADFDTWVRSSKKTAGPLTKDMYKELTKPGVNEKPVVYGKAEAGLYDYVHQKYSPYGPSDANHIIDADNVDRKTGH